MGWGALSEQQIKDLIAAKVGVNKVKMPSAGGSGYSAFSSATASSDGSMVLADTSARFSTNIEVIGISGQYGKAGEMFTATSAMVGKTISKITVRLAKVGSPANNVTIVVRNGSDAIVAVLGTFSATILSTSPALYSYTFAPYTIQQGDRILVEYAGDVSNYVRSYYNIDGGAGYDGTNSCFSGYVVGSGYSNSPADDFCFKLEFYVAASNAVDGDTSSIWRSVSQANPNIYADIGSSKLVSGCRVYWDAANRPTNYVIEASVDALAWSTVYAGAAQPASDAWTEYAFNVVLARYLRIRSTDAGGNNVIEVAEMEYFQKTTDQVLSTHGHGDP